MKMFLLLAKVLLLLVVTLTRADACDRGRARASISKPVPVMGAPVDVPVAKRVAVRKGVRCRDAVSGLYVSQAYARAHPASTVCETTKKR